MVPFVSFGTVSYSHSIATMALYCIVSEIHRDSGRKLQLFNSPAEPVFDAPVCGPRRNTAILFGV